MEAVVTLVYSCTYVLEKLVELKLISFGGSVDHHFRGEQCDHVFMFAL